MNKKNPNILPGKPEYDINTVPNTGNIHYDFETFLKDNLNAKDARICMEILKRNRLWGTFGNTYFLLIEASCRKSNEQINHLGLLFPALLSSVLHAIENVEELKEKNLIKNASVIAGRKMILAFLNISSVDSGELKKFLDEIISKNARQFKVDVQKVMKYFDFDHKRLNQDQMRNVKKRPGPSVFYVWTNKANLNILTNELKKKRFIKRKKPFLDLFQRTDFNNIVEWDALKKPHLAWLLYSLYVDECCIIRGSKGFFTYAEMCFRDFNGNPFPKGGLKKMKYKISKEPERYLDVINEVDWIMNKAKNSL